MASTTIKVKYYKGLTTNPITLERWWQINVDGSPTEGEITEALFRILDGETLKKAFSLGEGLDWNNTTKVLHLVIRNNDLSFLKDTGSYEYKLAAVLDGTLLPLKDGQLDADRVA